MFKSYLKTSFRFLLKNKTFSFINIIGLATGTLCCLYILLYVQDQYSYDKHHKDAQNIYRITTSISHTGDMNKMATCSPPIAPAMKNDFAEIVQYTRVVPTLGASEHLLSYKEKSFYESDAAMVDSTFFDVLTYHFVYGKAANALTEPNSVVLLKPVADKLFGTVDPTGKVITITDADGKNDFKITGVVDESLGKTTVKANLFIKMNKGGFGGFIFTNNSWAGNNFTSSYIKVRPNTNIALLESKLPAFLNKYGGNQLKAGGMNKTLHLQSIGSVHTTSGYSADGKIVSASFLYVLILIAILIQVIACINFMNLSTARASKRAKEVGVRKVIGAGKYDLVKQFLGESFLLAFIGVAIALPLLLLALPYLNEITNANIHLSLFADYRLWLMLAALIFITGFVAGSYPAFYLSAFKAIKVIKGNFTSHVSAAGIRRSLVVFQFVISIVLITGIIIVYSQLNYVKNKDLGFDKDQKLVFSFHIGETKSKMHAFANDLKLLTEVNTLSLTNNYPGAEHYHDWGVYTAGMNPVDAVDQRNLSSDENFVKTTGIKIISGRDLRAGDSSKVLINETLAKKLGLSLQNAIGMQLLTGEQKYIVAGVMKDFNYNSLRDEINPFMVLYEPKRDDIGNIIVSTNSKNYSSLLTKIETIWHKDVPATPFDYTFLNDQVQRQYETEATMSKIINSFTLVAILISCLGLFGLAAFSAEQRNKEIGIRKVLGASVSGIVQLLSKDFLKLVVISFVIATPIAWWAMTKWLQSFVYRIPVSWWMFALSGLIAVLIALFTVSSQAIKAALMNPVKSLKTE